MHPIKDLESVTNDIVADVIRAKGGFDDNSNMIFLISQQKHMLLPSLELPRQDGSNERLQVML